MLDVINQFRFSASATIGLRIKPIDRAAFTRPLGIIGGLIVRHIRWGCSFVTYRQGEVNKPVTNGKHERLSPTPQPIVMIKNSVASAVSVFMAGKLVDL